MSHYAEADVPTIDPRIEFWSGGGARWPRDWHLHIFAGRIVHMTGRLLYGQNWDGTEPETVLIHPLPARFDSATRPDELRWAIALLVRNYVPYSDKCNTAVIAGEPPPNPEPDEWQFAVGLSRQISNETFAAYDRYRQVVELLVSLLERGILRAALRPFFLGEPQPLPPGSWYNEVFLSWFATCQVDVERPFTGIPVRRSGHWIVFEAEPFYAWVAAVKRCAAEPENQQTASSGASSGLDESEQSETVAVDEGAGSDPPPDAVPTVSPDVADSDAALNNAGSLRSDDQSPKPKPKSKAGAKPRWPWAAGPFEEKILEIINGPQRPTSMHALVNLMLEWCQLEWGDEPGRTTIQGRIEMVVTRNGCEFP